MTSLILLSRNTSQRIKEMMDIANASFFSDTIVYKIDTSFLQLITQPPYNRHKELVIFKACEAES